ncbi:MAG: hypothetical protein Q9163_006381 [Psora crenata]
MTWTRLEKSRSQRILWLLEELKIDYDVNVFKRKDMVAPPELKKVHPLGKAPVITVSSDTTDGKAITIAESGNIIEYLIDHFGRWLAPRQFKEGKEGMVGGETEEWLRYRYFLHYAEGSLMPLLVTWLLLRIMKEKSPFFIKPVTLMLTGAMESKFLEPNLRNQFDFLEDQLKTSPNGGQYLCGTDLTGADIILSFPLGAARGKVGLTQEKYPKLWEYVHKLEQREGFQRAIQKIIDIEGSYSPAL